MSYEPTNWQAGDTVTSAKLNKVEQGIKNSFLIANGIPTGKNDVYLDKTWQEIYDADFCIIVNRITDLHMTVPVRAVLYGPHDENESLVYEVQTDIGHFYTDTPDGYPSTIYPPSEER